MPLQQIDGIDVNFNVDAFLGPVAVNQAGGQPLKQGDGRPSKQNLVSVV